MNKIAKISLLFLTINLVNLNSANAQIENTGNPEGTVVYSLPQTTLHITVEAEREVYTPGPYARYAKKYLGLDVEQNTQQTYTLSSVKLTPYLEADPAARYILNVGKLSSLASKEMFKMTSQGLILLADSHKGNAEFWRFPTLAENLKEDGTGATSNFTSEKTTLYKSIKNSDGTYNTISIQQSQVVEKSVERKAQDIADIIFKLREQRMNIICGNTDATYSGNAMAAAIEEMHNLESDYMSLFLGKTESATQKMSFDVTPDAKTAGQLYVAFRISDSKGLTLSDDVSGRPIALEISLPKFAETPSFVNTTKSKKSKDGISINYRVPSICLIKVIDGQDILLQNRVPLYQFGKNYQLNVD